MSILIAHSLHWLQMLSSKDINFVGYTYKNFEIVNDNQLPGMGMFLSVSDLSFQHFEFFFFFGYPKRISIIKLWILFLNPASLICYNHLNYVDAPNS